PAPQTESGTLSRERPLSVVLLTNRTTAKEREKLQAGLSEGSVDILIGTHALIEEAVAFKSLGAIVIDEQHRFGVEQRAALRGKGEDPDVLVMTATPIPRTAAMTVYGDLHVLVATTVIEVGVDIPNATVMLIEDAIRFGIAQLHQLRGRVGRGAAKSWCYLLGEATTPDAEERLQAMERTTDGFELAEVD